jgi:hypothetical protein
VSRTALGPTQPPIQWVPGAPSLGVKRPGREADPSPQSSAEVKNAWRYTSTSQYVFMAWCLVKHRDNFTFTFTDTKIFRIIILLSFYLISWLLFPRLRYWTTGVRLSAGADIFIFAKASSYPISFPGDKADHSPPSGAEVKNHVAIPPLPQYIVMAWCSVKHRGKFYPTVHQVKT